MEGIRYWLTVVRKYILYGIVMDKDRLMRKRGGMIGIDDGDACNGKLIERYLRVCSLPDGEE